MDLPPLARRKHSISNALGKTRLALQLLEQVGTLSATERRIIATGLDGLAELDAILRSAGFAIHRSEGTLGLLWATQPLVEP